MIFAAASPRVRASEISNTAYLPVVSDPPSAGMLLKKQAPERSPDTQ